MTKVWGWCLDGLHAKCVEFNGSSLFCACVCHTQTPADPGADECAADAAGEFERDLREYGVEL